MLLSAALIVKNEEQFLEECLTSIREAIDEVIVVDTGSTDRTQEIARDCGAKLYDFKWTNDFASARNYALDRAGGGWILYIDADERIRPHSASELRQQLLDPSYIAYYVSLHPKSNYTPYPELRIFRNDPHIRFQGRIHENIWPGIHRYRAFKGGKIGVTGLIFDHEGYEGDQHHKHQRNLPLLRRALREDPHRIFILCHLANIYLARGNERVAKKAWKRGLALVREKRGWLLAEDCLPYVGLLQLGLKQSRDIRELLAEALNRFPNNLHLHWLHGESLMLSDRFFDAIQVFEHIIFRVKSGQYDHAVSYDTRLFKVIPLSSLATCHFKLGNYGKSRHYFELAANSDPDNIEYKVKHELCRYLDRSSNQQLIHA